MVGRRAVVSSSQTLLVLGADENADETVTTLPAMLETARAWTVPSDRITDSMVPVPIARPVASSTVMAVVVADVIRPPRLTPALTGSLIEMIWPGRTIAPASTEAVKVHTSISFRPEYSSHSPIRWAWPREVQAKAVISVLTIPYFAIPAGSSTTS